MKRWFTVGAVFVVMAAIALGVRVAFVAADVWVVNGLPFPIEVELDDVRRTVEPDQHVKLGTFPHGARVFVTRAATGRELERRTIVLPRGDSIYNPFGAAPLASVRVTYASSLVGATAPTVGVLCGSSFVTTNADYVFTEPPSSLQLDSHDQHVTREAVMLLPGGFRRCMTELDAQQMAELLLEVARVSPERSGRQWNWVAARQLAQSGNKVRAREIAARLMTSEPDLEDHRMYQTVAQLLGETTALVERYRSRFETDPSPENRYLYARVLRAEQAWPLVETLTTDDPWLHRSRLWTAVKLRRFELVVDETRWCLVHSPELIPYCAEQATRALVALGKADDALTLLENTFRGGVINPDTAVLILRTADLANRKPSFDPFTKLERPGKESTRQVKLLKGDVSPSTEPDDPYRVLVFAQSDPARTLSMLEAQPRSALLLSQELLTLLTAEAVRTQRAGLASRLSTFLSIDIPPDDLQAWILRGEGELDLEDLDQDAHVAVLLARGRQLEALGREREAQEIYAQMSRIDVLNGLAVRALKRWPAPQAPKYPEGLLERAE